MGHVRTAFSRRSAGCIQICGVLCGFQIPEHLDRYQSCHGTSVAGQDEAFLVVLRSADQLAELVAGLGDANLGHANILPVLYRLGSQTLGRLEWAAHPRHSTARRVGECRRAAIHPDVCVPYSPGPYPFPPSAPIVILRCTKRLLDVLGPDRLSPVSFEPDPDDWYANLIWIERRKCLLLTHSGTLFSAFRPAVRASALRSTRALVGELINATLADEGLPSHRFGDLEHDVLVITKTADRQVNGCMNDLASICEHAVHDAGGLARLDVDQLNQTLHRIIHRARDYEPPIDAVRARLGSPD